MARTIDEALAGMEEAWQTRFSGNEAEIRRGWSELNAAKYQDGGGLETLATRTAPDESDGYR